MNVSKDLKKTRELISSNELPLTGYVEVFTDNLRKLSLNDMSSLDKAVRLLFLSVYQNQKHSVWIHQLIDEGKISPLIKIVGAKLSWHRDELWQDRLDELLKQVLNIKKINLSQLFPNQIIRSDCKEVRVRHFLERLSVIRQIHTSAYNKIKKKLGDEMRWLNGIQENDQILIQELFHSCLPKFVISCRIGFQWLDKEGSIEKISCEEIDRSFFGGSKGTMLLPTSIKIAGKNLVDSYKEGEKDAFYLRLFKKLNVLLSKAGKQKTLLPKVLQIRYQNFCNPPEENNFDGCLMTQVLKGCSFNAFGHAVIWLKEKYPQWNADLVDKENFTSKQDHQYGTHIEVGYSKLSEIIVIQKRRFLIMKGERIFGSYLFKWSLRRGDSWSGILKISSIHCSPQLDWKELEEFQKIF